MVMISNFAYRIRRPLFILVLREERTVLRFGNDVLKAQDERRHEQQYSDQADGDALCKDNAHVRADAEVHQTHRREADDRRHARGEISFLSNAVGAVLQLACSMDYSIFLLHSFTQERAQGIEPEQAMANAWRSAFSSIFASGMTTIVGFAAMCLMNSGRRMR